MKTKIALCFFLGLFQMTAFAQEADNTAILKIILSKYYKSEKVIAKGRLQLLSLYCYKAPNNEEVIEVINGHELLKKNAAEIKKQIIIGLNEDWSKEYNLLFDN
ncbi:MAG: hypothetical protein C0525_02950, partial [Flavobacterium sp.]|uniref:hypothetical protein n=1 Tax=Flavobacterium sp. TaxID=239 RepID=UPI0025BCFA69